MKIWIFLSVMTVPCLAQSAPAPNKIVDMLASHESAKERAASQLFNLTNDITGLPCSDYERVSLKTLAQLADGEVSAVEVYSGECVSKFWIIVANRKAGWSYLGTISVPDRVTEPSIRTEVSPTRSVLAFYVTNVTVDSGSGFSQTNLQIFTVMQSGRVQMALNIPEKVRFSVPLGNAEYVDAQESSFTFHSVNSGKAMPTIDEKRLSNVNGHRLSVYRRYVWNRRWSEYYSIPYAPSTEPERDGKSHGPQ